MKPLLLFVVLLVNSVNGQDLLLGVLPLVDAKVTYKNVHEVIGNSKMDLYNRAGEWYENETIPLEVNKPLDDTHHNLSGTYTFKTLWGPNDFPELYKEVEFKIKLTLKNERYQYNISNFIVKEPNQSTQLEIYKMDHKKLYKYNKAFYERIDTAVKILLARLEKAMGQ
jgi:hypothetical protein